MVKLLVVFLLPIAILAQQGIPVINGPIDDQNDFFDYGMPMDNSQDINDPQNTQSAAFFPGSSGNNVRCGFTCSRQTEILTFIDNVWSSVRCSDRSADVSTRCDPCCQAWALSNGMTTDAASGFSATNGDCVCCTNRRC